jgi:predicted AlkP superfamily pyrophosphatase or phosphodiesterase
MPKPSILFHGTNFTDQTVVISIDGVRYEYWFINHNYPSVVEHLAKHISSGKALAFAKKHASKCERLRP